VDTIVLDRRALSNVGRLDARLRQFDAFTAIFRAHEANGGAGFV